MLLSQSSRFFLLQFFGDFVWFVLIVFLTIKDTCSLQPKEIPLKLLLVEVSDQVVLPLEKKNKTHRQGCCPAVIMDWGNWVWRSKFFSATEPDSTRENLKIGPKVLDFWLLQFAETIWKSTSTFWWNEWALPKKRRQRGMDFTSGWNSHFISTLDETLVNRFGISSGKGTYRMEIILSPELHVCFFPINLFNRQIPESVNCFLICDCVSQMRFTSLKINGCEPENHLFEKQDHLPSTSARVYPRKIPPWTTKIGRFWFGQKWAPNLLVESQAQAARLRRDVRRLHECLEGAVALDQLHPWMPGDRWHRKIGVSWF